MKLHKGRLTQRIQHSKYIEYCQDELLIFETNRFYLEVEEAYDAVSEQAEDCSDTIAGISTYTFDSWHDLINCSLMKQGKEGNTYTGPKGSLIIIPNKKHILVTSSCEEQGIEIMRSFSFMSNEQAPNHLMKIYEWYSIIMNKDIDGVNQI